MDELLAAILRSGTPLVYVTLAAAIAQRAGVWHLGLEGLMIAAACASVIGTVETGSVALGVLMALAVCLAGSVLLWVVVEKLKADAIIAGLGLSGLGMGGSSLALQAIYGSEATITAPVGLPRLGEGWGAFGVLSVAVVALPAVVAFLFVLQRRTRFGLGLQACGEHPFAARSVGYSTGRMRLVALLIGGVLAAVAGAELALGSLNVFAVGMTAGRGFMGFAAAIFGAAHPIGATAAALFFSVVEALGIRAQLVLGERVPGDLLLVVPYAVTVIGIWASGWLRGGFRASLRESSELKDA